MYAANGDAVISDTATGKLCEEDRVTLPLDMCCPRAAAGSRMTRAIARCRSARTWTQRVREQNPKNGPLQAASLIGQCRCTLRHATPEPFSTVRH